jgi:hypothetical protein
MTVSELLAQFKDVAGDTLVYVWLDGERHPVLNVDDSFLNPKDGGFIEINVLTDA